MSNPRRFIASMLILVGLSMLTAACGHSRNMDPRSVPAAAVQVDLSGSWHQAHNGVPNTTMHAVVSGNVITIMLAMATDSSSDQVTGIYWQGSFDPTKTGVQTSTADKDAMADALLASEDPTKTFTCDGNTISFPFSILGVSTTVELSRGA